MLGSPTRASQAIARQFDPFSPRWSSSVSVENSAHHRPVIPAELLSEQFAENIVGFLDRKDPPQSNTHTIARSVAQQELLSDQFGRSIVNFLESDNLSPGARHSVDHSVIPTEQLHDYFEQKESLSHSQDRKEVPPLRASFSPFVTHSTEILQPLPVQPMINFPFHCNEPPHFIQPLFVSVQLQKERKAIHRAIMQTNSPSRFWQYLPALRIINNQLHSSGIEVERLNSPIPLRNSDRLLSDESGLQREIIKQLNHNKKPSHLLDKLARIENELARRIELDPYLRERNTRTYREQPAREFYA